MAGIYIHIPFCKQACHYCDFYFSTNQQTRSDIVAGLVREIELQQDYLAGETIETIYLGGGTPSILSTSELNSVFESLRRTFTISSSPEITLEANPDDLSRTKLQELLEAGVNRLSIGIQSFDNRVLKYLNRAHDAAMSVACVDDAYAAGFTNLSLDLIYAIPDQDDNLWMKNIEQVMALHPQHISAYSLTIEPDTAFGRWARQGKLHAVTDDQSATQLQTLVDMLEREDYNQYEVSNFAKGGWESQHNSSYWKRKKYLGIGPSAHSYDGLSRQYNVSNNHQYLQQIREGKIPATLETLSREDSINDYLLTTLRTMWGADLEIMKRDFAFDLASEQSAYLRNLVDNGLATLTNGLLVLTKKGKLLADKIASDLFVISP